MKNNIKLGLLEILTSIIVLIIGGFIVYKVAINALYTMGADLILKSSENCTIYKTLYIEEMKKENNGNSKNIIQQAKSKSCVK